MEIKRDCGLNLQKRRNLLEEVGKLLDDRWKLKGEMRDGYAADEADVERAQIESILGFLGDGTKPLYQCAPFGVCCTHTSRVTDEGRMVSGFRMVFRRTLKEGEEREESDVDSSSVPVRSDDSKAGSISSEDQGPGGIDESGDVTDEVHQETESAAEDEVQNTEGWKEERREEGRQEKDYEE